MLYEILKSSDSYNIAIEKRKIQCEMLYGSSILINSYNVISKFFTFRCINHENNQNHTTLPLVFLPFRGRNKVDVVFFSEKSKFIQHRPWSFGASLSSNAFAKNRMSHKWYTVYLIFGFFSDTLVLEVIDACIT